MKKFLIDTQILIWMLTDPAKLEENHVRFISDSSNTIFVSIASLWEMYIKAGLGKLTIPENFFDELEKNFITILPIEKHHLNVLLTLPDYHKDPFDRMIISQSIAEKIEVISYDISFEKYPVKLT